MTTIGDRIRIRRTTGERGQRYYSLRWTEASRAREPCQDIPEPKRQQANEAEATAAAAPQQDTEQSRRDSITIQHEPDGTVPGFQSGQCRTNTETLTVAEAGIAEEIPATGNVVDLLAAIEKTYEDTAVRDEKSSIIQEMEGGVGDINRTTED